MKRPIVTAWVMADQLTRNHPALLAAEAEVGRDRVRVAIVESRSWMRRLPFHKKRQVMYLSAGRHFAKDLEAAGFAVDLVRAEDSREGLLQHVKRHKPARLVAMEAAEYAPRRWQLGAMANDLGVPVEVLPNAMFLVEQFDPIPDPEPGKRYVMENFYRAMRKRFNLLMEPGAKPTGGAWNYDKENRRPWPKGHLAPPMPGFEPDEITRETMAEVAAEGFGVGSTEGFDLAVTREQALASFADFLTNRLPDFGPFEDAMRADEGVLHHSLVSPQMNLGLLDPLEMALAVEAEYRAGRAPLNSAEGFIRQVIGWREFMYWQYHRQMPGLRQANSWEAERPMPRMLWDGQTEMRCLSKVVTRLIETGHTHHIERLMVISNFAMLTGLDPAAVADWFLTFYVDSHDWVVLPNVIGMGLNADGGITATKPYIASAAYIHKMSNFCESCSFRRDQRTGPGACPFNFLYWNFLIEHEAELRANPRLGPAVLGLKHVGEAERGVIQAEAKAFLGALKPYESTLT